MGKKVILSEIRQPTPGRASFFPGIRGKPIVPRTKVLSQNKIVEQRQQFEKAHKQTKRTLATA